MCQLPARAFTLSLVASLVALLASACGSPTTDPAEPDRSVAPSRTAGSPATGIVRYGFEPGASASASAEGIRDDTGRGHTLRILAASGGAVTEVRHGTGTALQFPAPCEGRGPCARAILESPDSDDLDAGARPFRFGATVRVTAGQTSAGSNVVQKGYSTRTSQWKLQIDGGRGRPSCVLVGGDRRIHRAVAPVSVADGGWHTVECRRTERSLQIRLDGTRQGRATIPATLTVSNTEPLRIGGNGLGPRSDQFHGALDDVFFALL